MPKTEKTDICKNRAELLKNFKNGYSGIPPFNVAHPRGKGPGRDPEGPPEQGRSDPKKFFFKK